ncbi:hypothetical protein [Vibrio cyclitrophicus]|uniref:hypothetical protein n=1 Tax=Vibrio cyclitrophicus TaxID=47951 RepID=UPI000C832622|nr:hypothetical protein [Vibrio cyclitrophicus]
MIENVNDLVNFKVGSKNNEIKLFYSYVFEQIVSLYTYTVSNFYGDRKSTDFFTQQMRFTGAVTQKLSYVCVSNTENEEQAKNKIAYVLSLLDKGEKALDILEKIKSEDSLLNKHDVLLVERAMEENSIIFSRSFTEHPYSFQAMYSILKNPLLIFKRFLCLPEPGELLNIVIKCRLEKKIDRDELLRKEKDAPDFLRAMRTILPSKSYSTLSHGAVIESYNDQEVTLELLLEAYGDGRIKLDKSDFTELITRSIDDVLEGWASWVLDLLFPTSSKSLPMIDSLIDGVRLKQEGIIKLNMEDLKKLCLLGQAEQISDMLSKKIKELYLMDEKEKDKMLHMDTSQLSALVKWYRSCRMGYITEVSQIPSVISVLLYNRLENGSFYEYVMCSDNEIVDYAEKSKVDSLQRLVTFIIDKYLYHADPNPSLPYKDKSSLFEPMNTIDKYFDLYKISESDVLPNLSMVDWASYNKTKTRDRFKRPLKKFRSGIEQAKRKIEKQKQEGVHHYFPVSNNYPLPFWAMK